MDFEWLKNYQFYASVGTVVMVSSLLTLIITGIIKLILRKQKIIYEGMEASLKDKILSRTGRIVALLVYTSCYIASELYLRHHISLNEELISGLISGVSLTLSITKGLYASIRQYQKKNNVYKELKKAKETISELETKEASKWIITNKKIVKQKEEKL